MRIIAGTARSIPLKTVKGMNTRPTTDRIRETLFNMIQTEVPGAVFLDLFAGSGAIGLEALSRGAEYAVFVDSNRQAVACIEDNIASTKLRSRCEVKKMDYLAALRSLEGRFLFDIIFLDPPYGKGMAAEVLRALSVSSLCGEETMVIVEESLDFPPEDLEEAGYQLYRVKRYKTNQHIFLRREKSEERNI